MVLTVAQLTAFFTNNNQMGLEQATVNQLTNEGITTVDDLAEFDKESLQQVAENLHCPPGRVPDPTAGAIGGALVGATIPTPVFIFGTKSQQCLLVSCELVRYYEMTG